MKQKPDPIRHCGACGAQLVRKRFNGRLEDRTRFLSRLYCGERCMGDAMMREVVALAGYRSRAAKLRGSVCEACGATEGLHAHHRDEDPSNNASGNIATLCGSCHLRWHWRHGKRSKQLASTSAGSSGST